MGYTVIVYRVVCSNFGVVDFLINLSRDTFIIFIRLFFD